MDTYAHKRSSVPALQRIGAWATMWWGLTGLLVALWFWLARHQIARIGLVHGLRYYFGNSLVLQILASAVAAGWIAGGIVWLRVLRQCGISYRAALTDLFLTIRK
jgi:hypothetical protein